MPTTDLHDRVAIVTGAGGGLGRSHALQLARQGAAVVVNDIGGAVDGTGADVGAAQAVVDEIEAAGGRAVASTDGVDTWDGGRAIVATALDAFDRVDIVVNNAGILRDRSFAKLEPADLEAVLAVHLQGSFHVTHAAWPHLAEQGHGRVVMTSSRLGPVRQLRPVQLRGGQDGAGGADPHPGDRGRRARGSPSTPSPRWPGPA